MKKSVFLALCFLGLAVIAGPAGAVTADFQANCASGIPTNCSFDPTRTPSGGTPTACPGSSISQYFWDFGDGAWAWVTPPPSTTSHTYSGAIQTDVCLTVFCANGTSTTTCHCFANNIGVNGCIRPGAGWTP
jgi:PKD repeat protein